MSSIVYLVCDLVQGTLDVEPASVTLYSRDDTVIWVCPNLPDGCSLEVSFARVPCGPFLFFLTGDDGVSQVGAGNVGADEKGRNDYVYLAAVKGGGMRWEGSGTVVNLCQEEGSPSGPVGTCKPGDPPGVCELQR